MALLHFSDVLKPLGDISTVFMALAWLSIKAISKPRLFIAVVRHSLLIYQVYPMQRIISVARYNNNPIISNLILHSSLRKSFLCNRSYSALNITNLTSNHHQYTTGNKQSIIQYHTVFFNNSKTMSTNTLSTNGTAATQDTTSNTYYSQVYS